MQTVTLSGFPEIARLIPRGYKKRKAFIQSREKITLSNTIEWCLVTLINLCLLLLVMALKHKEELERKPVKRVVKKKPVRRVVKPKQLPSSPQS